jgi:hypothetical protein
LKESEPHGPAPAPPADLGARTLKCIRIPSGVVLYRIHLTKHRALHFGRETELHRRQRWDSPDASYGVCYLAEEDHIAFVETLLRDLSRKDVSERELEIRSITKLSVRSPLRLAAMHGKHLHGNGADASVVQGQYPNCWEWYRALHSHPSEPDGIHYRAGHDDSGFSIALFERAGGKVEEIESTELLDASVARTLGGWLDRYGLGLPS